MDFFSIKSLLGVIVLLGGVLVLAEHEQPDRPSIMVGAGSKVAACRAATIDTGLRRVGCNQTKRGLHRSGALFVEARTR